MKVNFVHPEKTFKAKIDSVPNVGHIVVLPGLYEGVVINVTWFMHYGDGYEITVWLKGIDTVRE